MKKNIHESHLEFSDFNPPIGKLGSLYPASEGILEAGGINHAITDGDVIIAEGAETSLNAVLSFDQNIDQIRKFQCFMMRDV